MQLDKWGEKIGLAIIGLGSRGYSQLKVLLAMPDVEIVSVCDRYPDRVERAQDEVSKARGKTPLGTADASEAMDREDVDAVIVMTGWETHISLAIQALYCGKRVAMEVGGSASLDECWQLVHASEATGIPVMMLENCCYGETELALLNMVRQNIFGTLIHCAGAYGHDLRDEVGRGDTQRHYRQAHFMHRNGELYPSHELGPIANYLNINRGNRMLTLTSMASKACGMQEWLKEHRPGTELADATFNQGDIVTTMIRCAGGETILLTHDCTLPRYYSRGGVIRGTKGMWAEDGSAIYLDGITPVADGDWMHRPESFDKYLQQYQHPLWKQYREVGIRGGHDGMDFLVLRAFIESVQNKSQPPIDVYDTASWMAITALTEQSIALGSQPVSIPDFTNSGWLTPRKNEARQDFEIN